MSIASTRRTASNALLTGTFALLPAAMPLAAQVPIKRAPSGFNLFSVAQDIDVGRLAAAEIERQLRVVRSLKAERFLGGLVSLLAAQAPGPRYPFSVTPVVSGDASLLVLPGGPMYVSTDLLSLSRTEAELAGVVAHSMAHIILRHGTERTSRAYVGKAGLSALGGRVGTASTPSRLVHAVGGLGTDAAFLTFGPTDEHEADALGAELMSRAGYDPVAIASVFAHLRREQRRHPGLGRFFANHPTSADRETRIRNLLNVFGHRGATEVVGGFSAIRWIGGTSPRTAGAVRKVAAGNVAPGATPITLDLPAPSSQFTRYNHPEAFLAIEHPANWEAYPSGFAISFAPSGGVLERKGDEPTLLQGVVVNFYAPFESDVDRWNNSLTRNYAPFSDRTRPRGLLEDATDDLVRQILGASPHLSAPTGSARSEHADGMRGYSVRLSGRSPVTGEMERVTVYTRALPDDHVVYLACISPGRGATAVERACARMVQSLRVNDAAAHR